MTSSAAPVVHNSIGWFQLTLGVTLNAQQQLKDFNFSGAPALEQAIATLLTSASADSLFVFGQQGVGKSHLLQACVLKVQDTGREAVFLSGKELLKIPPHQASECLAGLEAVALLCVDDLDKLTTDPEWALGWFHLYNELVQHGGCLIVSASDNPRNINCALDDLRSRLQLANVFQLQPLNDLECAATFKCKALHKGLQLSDDLIDYILSRSARGLPNLLTVLDRLDAASWHEKRRITIPFVKQVMGW